MAGLLHQRIHTQVNEKLVRPSDNRIIIGSNEKIKREVGRKVRMSQENSLSNIIEYWRNGLFGAGR